MKTVGQVLEDIDKLEKQYDIVNGMVRKMDDDDEISSFMFRKMDVDIQSLRDISMVLLNRRYDLEKQLHEIEVDVR